MRGRTRELAVLALIFGCLLATGLAAPKASAQVVQEKPLAEVETLFAAGDFEATARRVNEMLVRDADLPVEQRSALYLIKARLELAFDRPTELRLWLTKAYYTNPALELDPVKDPPQLIAVYDEIRGVEVKPGQKRVADEKVALKEGDAFAPGLLPLGIGHFGAGRIKDGALFLSADLLSLLALATLPTPEDGGRLAQRLAFGLTTFSGIYGYELLDLTPDLTQRDPTATGKMRYALSFFPFGVAQAKNREPLKAWSIATVHAALLAGATLAPSAVQRDAALGVLVATWGYSIYDGLKRHQNTLAADADETLQLAVVPLMTGSGQGAALRVTYDF